jgi:hypothetical protein
MMQIQAVEVDGNKVYQTPIGLLPAVNTILDATTPPEEEAGLEAWRQKTKNHQAIRDQSAARGTALHQLAATFLETGREPDWIDPQIEPYWGSLKHYLDRIARTAQITHPIYDGRHCACEFPIYHPTLGYAGTPDWMGEVDLLEITLTDFKSSRWYKDPKYTMRHRLQAAAYRLAIETLFDLEIDHIDIVIAIPKYRPQILHLSAVEMEEDEAAWLERLKQYQALQQGGVA